MEVKDITALISTLLAVFIGLYNWNSSRTRAKLKDDLDIIKKYREEFLDNPLVTENVRYNHLRQKIERKIEKKYSLQGVDFSDVLSGVMVILIGITAFAFRLSYPDLRNLIITIAVGLWLVGAFFIWQGVKDKNIERNNSNSGKPGNDG